MEHTPHELIQQHKHRLKNIKVPLIPQNRTRLVLRQCPIIPKVLNRSIHRARKDQSCTHIHDPKRDRNLPVVRKAKLCAAIVEDCYAEDEEGNDDELQHETGFEEDRADVEEVVG